ncbi:MAG: segregation/condensation protein A [Deltaproteobacteria bacterium]|nr:segregation/condensation protein A [Deltaproteobacteria bacterium]
MSQVDPVTDSSRDRSAFSEDLEGAYAVKLPIFEGPLDLLLHLIRQNEVDVKDIPISLIGEQYLDYIDLMQDLNIDVAAEYLVMAATLALIKSRMLLPNEEAEGEGEALDPRAELVARLLEYQRFKEAAQTLSERRWLDRDIYRVSAPGVAQKDESEREIEVGLFDLIEAFRSVLEELHTADLVHQVDSEPVTVRDRMVFVMRLMDGRESLEFTEIFRLEEGGPPHRSILVATFLAMLELTRLEALHLFQGLNEDGAPEGPIRLRLRPGGGDTPDWQMRITDTM